MYAIIRAQKHKAMGAVARSARHTFREQPTPNAAAKLRGNNLVSGCKNTDSLLRALKSSLPDSRRKDAVICIEYLITASPEAFSRHGGHLDDLGSGYFRDALKWLQNRHGKENVICTAIHLDESTPHLVAYVCPITTDGRLSARDFLGGPKVMRAMQDSFYEQCGRPRGLSRGVKGSKAEHGKISQFYTSLSSDACAPKLRPSDYAAKAVGFETKAWREAQEIALAQTQDVAYRSTQRKSISARNNALDRAEHLLRANQLELSYRQKELAHRERSIEKLEQELMRRKPELDIANARAEAAERAIEEDNRRQSTNSQRQEYIKRLIHSKKPPTPLR